MWEEGRVSGKVTSSSSSKAQSLPTENSILHRVLPNVPWNQILQFAVANKIEETRYIFDMMLVLIRQWPLVNKTNNVTLAEEIGRSVTKA